MHTFWYKYLFICKYKCFYTYRHECLYTYRHKYLYTYRCKYLYTYKYLYTLIYRLCSVLDSPQGFEEHDHLLDAFYLFLKQSTHLGTWEFLLFINKITWVVDWWPYISNWSYGLHASHHKEENMGHGHGGWNYLKGAGNFLKLFWKKYILQLQGN